MTMSPHIPQDGLRRHLPLATLVLVGVCWGLGTSLNKIMVEGQHPAGLIFWQLLIITSVLTPITLWRGKLPQLNKRGLLLMAGIASFGTLVPNTASYIAISHLPAGIMAIVLAAVPIFALLLSWGLRVEQPSMRRLGGISVGVLALILLALPDLAGMEGEASELAGAGIFVLIAMIAPLCYGFEGVFVTKVGGSGTDPIANVLGASIMGVIVLAPVMIFLPSTRLDILAFEAPQIALIGNSLVHTVCYTGYLTIVRMAGPVFASQVAYVVTLAGVGWGMLIFGETHGAMIWLAFALMMVAVSLVRPRRQKR